AFGGALLEALATGGQGPSAPAASPAKRRKVPAPVLKVLWITPLRALASDTVRALCEPIEGLGLEWQVGLRTGDASARDKRLARRGRLDGPATTPGSPPPLLSSADTATH